MCTGLQLVNFLQDVPRDLALGRVYLPAEDRRRLRVTVLDGPNGPLTQLLYFQAERAAGLLAAGEHLRAAIGGRTGKAVGLFARGGLAALDALRDAQWDVFTRAAAALAPAARSRRRLLPRSMTTVDEAYTEVERLTRARARNFAYGIMLLPKPKRRAIAAIYAFAREVDDVADDPGLEIGMKRERLEELRAGLDDGAKTSAMFVALADARRRFPIPGEALHDLIDGGLQDTEQARYATFDDLRGYCRRVAGAVGVACVAVYGAADERQRAETLGVALQLINIIRDVAEDWDARARVPAAGRAGRVRRVRGGHRAPAACTAEWRALMAHQAKRARAHLAEGRTLLPRLDRRSAACVADVREPLRGDARPDRGARLRRVRRPAAAVAADEAPHRGRGAAAVRHDLSFPRGLRPSTPCRERSAEFRTHGQQDCAESVPTREASSP